MQNKIPPRLNPRPNRYFISIEGKTSSYLYPKTEHEGYIDMTALEEVHTQLQHEDNERHKVVFYAPNGGVLEWYDTNSEF